MPKNKTAPLFSRIIESTLQNTRQKLQEVLYNLPDTSKKRRKNQQLIQRVQSFLKKNDLIIKPSDKNLGITIMDRCTYIEECLKQLNNPIYYKKSNLSKEVILQNQRKLLQEFAKHHKFTSVETNYILYKLESTEIPYFYTLPKIHKSPMDFRPIVASTNWTTTQLSIWIGIKLQNHIHKCQHLLKNTNELILDMEKYYELISEHATGIMTLDITALYNNMDVNLIETKEFKDFLKDDKLYHAIVFILRNNFLQFNGEIYHQSKGMAMGTNMAVLVANIYCHLLIDKILTSKPKFQQTILYFKRYIDDVIIFIKKPDTTKKEIVDLFKETCPSLSFTASEIKNNNVFLDLEIDINGNCLTYKTYQKPLNLYSYIPPYSTHHKKLQAGFIKGELIRYLRNSATETTFNLQKYLFYHRLEKRKYSKTFLQPIMTSIQYNMRKDHLQPKEKTNNQQITPFIIEYNDTSRRLPILKTLEEEIEKTRTNDLNIYHFLKQQKFILAYKSQPNLLRLLTTSNIQDDPPQKKNRPTLPKRPLTQITLEELNIRKNQRNL